MRQNLCWGGGWGGITPPPAPKLGLGEVGFWGGRAPPLEAPTGVEICGWGDSTSGYPRVLDSASFCQVTAVGSSAPDQRHLSTWGRLGCRRQCPSPRVLGQGPCGATGVRQPDKSVCQRISQDQRRTSDRIPASVDL